MNPKAENNTFCLVRRGCRSSIIVFDRVDKASGLAKSGRVQQHYGHRPRRPRNRQSRTLHARLMVNACISNSIWLAVFFLFRGNKQTSLPSSQAIDVPDLLQTIPSEGRRRQLQFLATTSVVPPREMATSFVLSILGSKHDLCHAPLSRNRAQPGTCVLAVESAMGRARRRTSVSVAQNSGLVSGTWMTARVSASAIHSAGHQQDSAQVGS